MRSACRDYHSLNFDTLQKIPAKSKSDKARLNGYQDAAVQCTNYKTNQTMTSITLHKDNKCSNKPITLQWNRGKHELNGYLKPWLGFLTEDLTSVP